MNFQDPLQRIALFRLSVLGPLASRQQFERGEVTRIATELASKTYTIPDSNRTQISMHTILRWYGIWKRHGFEGLVPKERSDKGKTVLTPPIQHALLQAKKEKPSRSIKTLIHLLVQQGVAAKRQLKKATVHRFLRQQKMSKRIMEEQNTRELCGCKCGRYLAGRCIAWSDHHDKRRFT